MKKFFKVICIAMCVALLFVGCSNSSGGGSSSLIKSKYDFDGTPYTLFTQQERRIWYYDVYNIGNGQIQYDASPSDIIIVENGTVAVYDIPINGITYGEIAEKTDDEIVEYCKTKCQSDLEPINETDYEELREYYNMYNIGDIIKTGESYSSYHPEYTLSKDSDVIEIKNEVPEKLSNVSFKINRDSTGNEAVSERVDFRKFSYEYFMNRDNKFMGGILPKNILSFSIYSWTAEPQIIYSTKFAVLYCNGGSNLNYDTLLSTKIDGEFRFDFDAPDTDFGIYK